MHSLEPIPLKLVEEGRRMMTICNACRYCEGYCAVFPALERRLSFTEGDLNYLANLCHNCGACYHACQYAPPHEFALNFPRMLAEIRVASYGKYAWPGWLAGLYRSNGVAVGTITAASIALFFIALMLGVDASVLFSAHRLGEGGFYAVIPHTAMVWSFGAVSLFVLGVLVTGFVRFWRDTGESFGALLKPVAILHGIGDALSMKYLGGGSDGCSDADDTPSLTRRRFHHLSFYGFLLCFAATSVATLYHYGFGWKAPYALTSLPVLLGTLGGIGLLAGPAGLLWLKRRRDPALSDPEQAGMDAGFLALLLLTSATGLGLLALRETPWMGIALAAHLGAVMGFFLTVPYGKFVHAVYRLAALVRYAVESSRTAPKLGPD
jgi:citrate/tricarballylate utilization protein